MAISAAPFALKNLGLDAEQLRQAIASLLPSNGGLVQIGDLAVTQTGTPSLGVSVGVGRAWLPGNTVSNLAGRDYSSQGMYFAFNDAAVTVNLATANATNPRIDLIYIGAVDSQYGGASDVIKIDKITGTPAATPVAPTLPAGSNAIALSQVAVAANATSVTNANITLLGMPSSFRHAEFTSGSIAIPANSLYGPGAYTADNSATVNGGFAAPDTTADCISIQPGLYQISFRVTGTTAIPNGWLEIHSKDDSVVYYGNTIAGVGTGGSGGVSVNLYFPAATIIRPRIYLTSAWTMSATRARITKLA